MTKKAKIRVMITVMLLMSVGFAMMGLNGVWAGCAVLPLRYKDGVGPIYVYCPEKPEQDLSDNGANALLQSCGSHAKMPINAYAK